MVNAGYRTKSRARNVGVDMRGIRVFVSSPCYDNIDVRAEVDAHLKSMGFVPFLSDDGGARFKVSTDTDSIETCLVNLRASDYVVVILSKRYGPIIPRSTEEKLSATHIEYREARAHGKPIYFFARDQLLAEYSLVKANRRENIKLKLRWIDEKDVDHIVALLDEQMTWKQGTSNWCITFRNSLDVTAEPGCAVCLLPGLAAFAAPRRCGMKTAHPPRDLWPLQLKTKQLVVGVCVGLFAFERGAGN